MANNNIEMKNEIEDTFCFYPIDEAVEICTNKMMRRIERKLDYQQQKFIDNVVTPFEVRHQEMVSEERNIDYIMKTPLLRGVYNFANAVRELNNMNVNPN